MNKRVYIIHGWDDLPTNGWFPWLKNKLTDEGFEVHAPVMPDAGHPTIEIWVPFLKHAVGQADENTFFVGHSVGCQTILRYIETLPAGTKVGGVVMVAPWVTLKAEAMAEDDTANVALPWIQRPIHWSKIRQYLNRVVVIMSDDDQFVPVEDGKVFVRELHAELIMEHHKRHLGGYDGVTALASVHGAMRKMLG